MRDVILAVIMALVVCTFTGFMLAEHLVITLLMLVSGISILILREVRGNG